MEEQFWVNKLMPALKVSIPHCNPSPHPHPNNLCITCTQLGKISKLTYHQLDSLASFKPMSMWMNNLSYRSLAHTLVTFIKFTIYPILTNHQLDSLASSHPVSMPVQDPKEIEAIFDTISYKKVSIIVYHHMSPYMINHISSLSQSAKRRSASTPTNSGILNHPHA